MKTQCTVIHFYTRMENPKSHQQIVDSILRETVAISKRGDVEVDLRIGEPRQRFPSKQDPRGNNINNPDDIHIFWTQKVENEKQ